MGKSIQLCGDYEGFGIKESWLQNVCLKDREVTVKEVPDIKIRDSGTEDLRIVCWKQEWLSSGESGFQKKLVFHIHETILSTFYSWLSISSQERTSCVPCS